MANDRTHARASRNGGLHRLPWLRLVAVAVLLTLGAGGWAWLSSKSRAMHWYTGPLHRQTFEQAKQYFRDSVPDPDKLAFNNLFVHQAYGIANVCGEVNIRQPSGDYSGFLLFYVELIEGSPEKVGLVAPDLDEAKLAEWKTYCGEGNDTARLFSERLNRLLLAAKASLNAWSEKQGKK